MKKLLLLLIPIGMFGSISRFSFFICNYSFLKSGNLFIHIPKQTLFKSSKCPSWSWWLQNMIWLQYTVAWCKIYCMGSTSSWLRKVTKWLSTQPDITPYRAHATGLEYYDFLFYYEWVISRIVVCFYITITSIFRSFPSLFAQLLSRGFWLNQWSAAMLADHHSTYSNYKTIIMSQQPFNLSV